jgi:hypothetical protein
VGGQGSRERVRVAAPVRFAWIRQAAGTASSSRFGPGRPLAAELVALAPPSCRVRARPLPTAPANSTSSVGSGSGFWSWSRHAFSAGSRLQRLRPAALAASHDTTRQASFLPASPSVRGPSDQPAGGLSACLRARVRAHPGPGVRRDGRFRSVSFRNPPSRVVA